MLEEFRHVTGAYFSRRIDEHNRVRQALSSGTGERGGGGRRAMELFVEMAREVTMQEHKRPELVEAVASYGFIPRIR